MSDSNKFLTIKETCQFLNVKESFLRKLIFKKEIPFHKIGEKLIRFQKEELLAWITRG